MAGTKNKYIYVLWLSLVLLLGISLYGLTRRPIETVSQVQLPSDSVVPVYNSLRISQQIQVGHTDISSVSFWLAEDEPLPPDDTPLILHVRSLPHKEEVRTVQTTFGEAAHHERIKYRDENITLEREIHVLHFPFIPLANASTNVSYEFSLEAPTLTSRNPLPIWYQLDDSIYPNGNWYINEKEEEGVLGFVLYRRPSMAMLAWEWLNALENRLAWPGMALVIMGLITWGIFLFRKPLFSSSIAFPYQTTWRKALHSVSRRELLISTALILAAVFTIYQPALKLFFVQDDIDILLRVKELRPLPALLFTNHRYIPPDESPEYAIGFYRPLSYSFFPWLMYQVFGLSAAAHFIVHLLLFSFLTWLMYLFTRFFGTPVFAAFITSVWLAHSSKADIAYWLSSAQDLLASIFFMAALLTYMWLRAEQKTKYLWLVGALYSLALFSKDVAIVFPAIIFLLESFHYLQKRTAPWQQWLTVQVKILAPLVCLAGMYLIIRTIALGDPTLPYFPVEDFSYELSLTSSTVLKNIIAYGNWSAEHWLWPGEFPLLQPIESSFQQFMASTLVSGPYYPFVFLSVALLAGLFFIWKQTHVRFLLLFAASWWATFLLPTLLLANERNSRWLTLALWGFAFGIALIGRHIFSRAPRIPIFIQVMLPLAIIMYGMWVARLPQTLENYQVLSHHARSVVESYAEIINTSSNIETITFVGAPKHMDGTINRHLLLLFFENVPSEVTYTQQIPQVTSATEAVLLLEDQ